MQLANVIMGNENQYDSQPPLIMVVEDNEDNLLLMNYALESLGCRTICQKDSSTTVVLAKEYQPDLILLDILMPGLNGLDVVRHLKQEPLTRNIAAIAVTALASSEDKERILRAGFDDYISKPYMIEDLEALIYHYLSRRSSPMWTFNFCQDCQE
jgi:CheY-like chemotaxis protein